MQYILLPSRTAGEALPGAGIRCDRVEGGLEATGGVGGEDGEGFEGVGVKSWSRSLHLLSMGGVEI